MTGGSGTSAGTAGIVLAAGASTRMGASVNKLLLDIDGEPMVRRAVRRALEAGLSPVVVVLGHEGDRVRAALHGLACTFAVSPDPRGPTSGSLHAGLGALDGASSRAGATASGAVVILLGDMVRVTAAMIHTLALAVQGTTAPLVVSRYGEEGVLAPPLLFRRALWPELLAWHGEGCGKAVVNAHRSEALMLDWPADALRDIDTPDDYEGSTR